MVDSPGGREVGRLSLKILPDTTEFVPKLKAFAERVEKQLKVEIPVELDIESAWDDIKRLQAQIKAADTKVNIKLEVDSAGAIAGTVAAMTFIQSIASSRNIHVDLELDGAGLAAAKTALVQTGSQGASAIAPIGRQLAMWGPLIFVAAVGIAALAPALAVVLPLVAGIAAAGAVFALGWKDVKKVFGPLVSDIKDMRKEIGQTLTAGLGPLISKVSDQFMPVLKTGLTEFAKLMNELLRGTLHFLQSTPGLALVGQLFTGLSTALKPFVDLLPVMLRIFLRLTIAALPALQMMGDAILRVSREFNKFLAKGTTAGVITQSMSQLGEVLTIIGRLAADIFPSLLAAAPAVIAFLSGFGEAFGSMFKLMKPVFAFMSKHKTTMGALGAALAVLVVGLGAFAAVMFVVNAVMAVNPFFLAAVAIIAIGAALVYAYKHSETFRNVINKIGDVIGVVVGFIVDHWKIFAAIILIPIVPLIALVALIVLNFGRIKSFIVSVFMFLLPFFLRVWNVIKTIVQIGVMAVLAYIRYIRTIIGIVTAVFSTVVSAIRVAWGVIKGVVKLGIAVVVGYIRGVQAVIGIIRSAFGRAKDAVVSVVTSIVSFVKGIPGKITGALTGLGRLLYDEGRAIISGLMDGILDKAKDLYAKVKGIGAKIKSLKGPLSYDRVMLRPEGAAIIDGLIYGIASREKALYARVGNIGDNISSAMSTVFDPAAVASGVGSLQASVGAIVDNTVDNGAKEVIINWQTGRGVMVDIATDEMARKEFLASQDDLMGVGGK